MGYLKEFLFDGLWLVGIVFWEALASVSDPLVVQFIFNTNLFSI
jgi:hypothetical protein